MADITVSSDIHAFLSSANKAAGRAAIDAAALPPAISALTYASTLDLAFTAAPQRRSLALTGNITFTGSGYGDGREMIVFIAGDTVTRTLAFPSNWKFIGPKPTELAANKSAVLSLQCISGADTGCFAAWRAEA